MGCTRQATEAWILYPSRRGGGRSGGVLDGTPFAGRTNDFGIDPDHHGCRGHADPVQAAWAQQFTGGHGNLRGSDSMTINDSRDVTIHAGKVSLQGMLAIPERA